MTTRSRRAGGTPAAGVVLALALVGGLLVGCSSDDSETPGGPTASSGSVSAGGTDIRVAEVRGKLSESGRQELVGVVGRIVDQWIDGGYLGVPPRRDVSAAFAGFTPGARADAMRDRALLSNADVRGLEAVTADRRTVRLDVLAPDGRAAGVTARVELVLRLEGERSGRERVGGALYLSPFDSGWKIFGYDLSRGVSR